MPLPWFKFWLSWTDEPAFDDLAPGAQGLFLKMLIVQWREGSVPGDPEELARKCRYRLSDVQMHLHMVLQMFMQGGDGRYVFRPLEDDRERSGLVSRARSGAAQKRWNKEVNANASANGHSSQPSNVDAHAYRSKKLDVRRETEEEEEDAEGEAREIAPGGASASAAGATSAPPVDQDEDDEIPEWATSWPHLAESDDEVPDGRD